ncbi:hypothetical protein HYPSUDRAFT_142021 [Hypholoma sublateritium FD-334 SS-4]|uniref:Adenosine deaminase domain-containing protein n=1 Tax=Hypholoma sublateritium (strain FD-334 SS-4) TaxID=945553 RepID=A0A0D2NVG4_HYPSF|nr:hypothetical protein HYPSUDRAFT_142021 [Hypholoma sublateritium FD-334 SS-4]
MQIFGPAADALNTLTPSQIDFLERTPKAELHAHLNGSIPLPLLQELAAEHLSAPGAQEDPAIRAALEALRAGPALAEIHDFFHLFPAIYALTSTPRALARAADAVLAAFLGGARPQCAYLELRTTPRATPAMDRAAYLATVLSALERYAPAQAGLIVSLDRRMGAEALEECVALACALRAQGRRVVGVDLCGDPLAGDMALLGPYLARVQAAGLGVTLHIAETTENTPEETLQLLSYGPQRLGHATFLDAEAIALVLEKKMCIEICLSSNILCKTVSSLESHHISQYLTCDHPVSICTDDILPFRTSLIGEYALLLAAKPLGLGLSEAQVARIAAMSMSHRFSQEL